MNDFVGDVSSEAEMHPHCEEIVKIPAAIRFFFTDS
jgi:hypothetical protein